MVPLSLVKRRRNDLQLTAGCSVLLIWGSPWPAVVISPPAEEMEDNFKVIGLVPWFDNHVGSVCDQRSLQELSNPLKECARTS